MKLLLKLLGVVLFLGLAAALAFYLRPLAIADAMLRYRLWREAVSSESVTVDTNRIHYLEAKPAHPNGQTLLLIHGLGDRSEAWAPLIPKFAAAGFHVYALDLPGYGRSSKPPDAGYSVGYEEKAVAGFMSALGIAHADVDGWSMGGWVALKLALDRPDLVRRLVVCDSAGIYWAPSWQPELFDPKDEAAVGRLFAMLTPNPPKLPPFVVKDLIRRFTGQWWVVDRGLTSMRTGRDLLDFRLAGIKQPTLLVWGAKDQLIPVEVGNRMHQAIPSSRLEIVDGCGHLAPSECTDPVLKDTLAFLNGK